MQWYGIVGCALQAWGPILAVIVMHLQHAPQLILFGIAASFVFVMGATLCALVWTMIPPAQDAMVLHAFLGVAIIEATRYGFFRFYLMCERGFGSKFKEVVYVSDFAVAPVAVASGLGWGASQSLLSFGMIFAFHADPLMTTPDASFYDKDLCPGIPYLYYQALQSCFYTVANVGWMVLAMGGYYTLHHPKALGVGAGGAQYRDASGVDCRLPFQRQGQPLTQRTARLCLGGAYGLHLLASLFTLVAKWGGQCAASLPLVALTAAASAAAGLWVTRELHKPVEAMSPASSPVNLPASPPHVEGEAPHIPAAAAPAATTDDVPAAAAEDEDHSQTALLAQATSLSDDQQSRPRGGTGSTASSGGPTQKRGKPKKDWSQVPDAPAAAGAAAGKADEIEC